MQEQPRRAERADAAELRGLDRHQPGWGVPPPPLFDRGQHVQGEHVPVRSFEHPWWTLPPMLTAEPIAAPAKT